MKEELLKIKPPAKYCEGIIKFQEGFDTVPDLLEYLQNGYTANEAKKMELLVSIETMKKLRSENDLSEEDPDELKQFDHAVMGLISQYNQI